MARGVLRVLLTCALAFGTVGAAVADRVSAAHASTAASATAGTYVPVAPARLLDTRKSLGGARPAAHGTVHLQVLGRGSVPATGVAAVALNVTVTSPARSGDVRVFADGAARPTVSNLNFGAGQTVADLTVTRVGSNGQVSLYNDSSGTAQLVADVAGYYLSGTPSSAGRLRDDHPDAGAGHPVEAGRHAARGPRDGAPAGARPTAGCRRAGSPRWW